MSGEDGVSGDRTAVGQTTLFPAWVVWAAGIGILALLGLSGWATVLHSWSQGFPWWSGFRVEYLATPIAAFVAAAVAVTTAWWSVRNSQAARRAEHARWMRDRDLEAERVAERSRTETERTLRDRFHELIKLLADHDLRAREGAAYALAALADDWEAHYGSGTPEAIAEQQVCINVLISHLRDPLPDDVATLEQPHAGLAAFKEVVQEILRSRLGRVSAGKIEPGVWSSFDLVFDGCTLHRLSFGSLVLAGDKVSFDRVRFAGEYTYFSDTHFAARWVSFSEAKFTDGWSSFDSARFFGTYVLFANSHFQEGVSFRGANFTARPSFNYVTFSGYEANFEDARFHSIDVDFWEANFNANEVSFDGAHFTADRLTFGFAHFAKCQVSFRATHFKVGCLDLDHATFNESSVMLNDAIASFARSTISSRVESPRFVDVAAQYEVAIGEFPEE